MFLPNVTLKWHLQQQYEPTQSGDPRLHHEHGGARHHPRLVLVLLGGGGRGGQRPPGLRVRVRHTQRLLAVVLLAQQDVALRTADQSDVNVLLTNRSSPGGGRCWSPGSGTWSTAWSSTRRARSRTRTGSARSSRDTCSRDNRYKHYY